MSGNTPLSTEDKAAFVRDALEKAEEHRRADEHKEGISLLVEALKYGVDRAQVYYRLGNLYIDSGDLTRAEYVYKRALEVDPKHINAMHNLSIVYKRQKKISEYVKTYKRSQRMALRHPRNYKLDRASKKRVRALSARILLWIVAGVAVIALLIWALAR